MAVTPPDTIHAQGEKLVSSPILKPPDPVILDHANVCLDWCGRGLRVGEAQAQKESTHK